jgi:hypothetical protein
MSFVWSEHAVALLHRFYVQEGLSAAQTAAALAQALDGQPTRNAVLGKAQRLGWTKPQPEAAPAPVRPAGFGKAPRGVVRRPRWLPDVPLPPLREVQTGSTPKLWTERLWGECAYPVGEPAAPGLQLCCGAPTDGATYCRSHRGLMMLPKSELGADERKAIMAVARRAA